MIIVIHKSCGGPALEADPRHEPTYLKDANAEIWIRCLTCLEEITDREELTFGEEMGSYHQPL